VAATVADPTREIAVAYGMIDPELKDAEGLPLTCRSVFIMGESDCQQQQFLIEKASWPGRMVKSSRLSMIIFCTASRQ
jgi:alkyl hydroperoxide reductase subunit AhpC